jgi:hypothetical protein
LRPRFIEKLAAWPGSTSAASTSRAAIKVLIIAVNSAIGFMRHKQVPGQAQKGKRDGRSW